MMIHLDNQMAGYAASLAETVRRHDADLRAWPDCPQSIRDALTAADMAVLWSLSQSVDNWSRDSRETKLEASLCDIRTAYFNEED